MGLISRVTEIVGANLNALLDRLEDPQRMLVQIIREMEESLASARQQAAEVVAGERRLAREIGRTRAAAESWKDRARLALVQQREDLARQALARHLEDVDLAKVLEEQYDTARRTSAATQAAIHMLKDRLDQARRQERLLDIRQQAVQVRAESLASADAGNPRSPFARFTRLENRLAVLQDDLLIYVAIHNPERQLKDELSQLETDQRLLTALAALKAELE